MVQTPGDPPYGTAAGAGCCPKAHGTRRESTHAGGTNAAGNVKKSLGHPPRTKEARAGESSGSSGTKEENRWEGQQIGQEKTGQNYSGKAGGEDSILAKLDTNALYHVKRLRKDGKVTFDTIEGLWGINRKAEVHRQFRQKTLLDAYCAERQLPQKVDTPNWEKGPVRYGPSDELESYTKAIRRLGKESISSRIGCRRVRKIRVRLTKSVDDYSKDDLVLDEAIRSSENKRKGPKEIEALGGIYVPLKAGTQHLWACVDTGSDITIMSREKFLLLQAEGDVKSWRCDLTASVANDQAWTIDEYAIVEFTMGDTRYAHIVYVTPDISDEVILGLDFLAKHGVDVRSGDTGSERGPSLLVNSKKSGPKEIPCVYGAGQLTSSSCKMVSATAEAIPSRHSKLVAVQAPMDSQVEWHESEDITGILQSPLMPKDSAVTIRDGVTHMLVVNNSGTDLEFLPGQELATFRPRKIKRHEDENGNPYLYHDMNGCLVERLDVCFPWEHIDDREKLERLRPYGVLPVAKVLTTVKDDHVHRELKYLDDSERSIIWSALTRDLRDPGAEFRQIGGVVPKGKRARKVQTSGALEPIDDAEKEIEDIIDDDGTTFYTSADALVGDQDISNLTPEETARVRAVLSEFESVMTPNLNATYPNEKMPPYAKMKIVIPEGTKPIRWKPYPVSKHKKKLLEERIRPQLRQKMIEPSSSEWSAPSFVILKADNKTGRT